MTRTNPLFAAFAVLLLPLAAASLLMGLDFGGARASFSLYAG